jgi:hypothetical protein
MNIGFNDKEGNDVDADAIMIMIIIINVIYGHPIMMKSTMIIHAWNSYDADEDKKMMEK